MKIDQGYLRTGTAKGSRTSHDDDNDDDESIELVFANSYSNKNSRECTNRDMLWQTVSFYARQQVLL